MEPNETESVLRFKGCSFPTPENPYYHARFDVELRSDQDWQIERVEGNGRRIRDFKLFNDGKPARGNICTAGAHTRLVVRLDWADGGDNRVEIQLCGQESKQQATIAEAFRSPDYGGYWDTRWKYYASAVVTESEGLPRTNEPFHTTLAVYADRVTDPQREVRVVAIDPLSGMPAEVPSQVYGISTWAEFTDIHCQPTTTFEVAFLADLAANSSKVYLIFYGNPDAEMPEYQTDLVVSGEGLGLTVENSFYRMKMQPTSGAIDEILMKMGADQLYDHHLETNGAVHWNPDVYAPPREWIHCSDWNPPAGYATIKGPIFFMSKRWGPLPQYPEVQVSVTYLFYAHNPAVIMSSTTDVEQDINVQALRNGEIVFNHNVFREFAWKKADGSIGQTLVKDRPRHPTRGLDLPVSTRWWALYNRDLGCALGAANLELTAMRRRDGLVRFDPWIYLQQGPWVYVARPLIYTFATTNPQRVMFVPGGSTYYEKIAYFPFPVDLSKPNPFEFAERQERMLAHPLEGRAEIDIDERAPEGWVPPILVEEFEEM